MQRTLVDLFELRNDGEYVPPQVIAPRQSIDLEIDWDAEMAAQEEAHDWSSSSTESSPGVSYESWKRARGWCAE